jgi:hypothetical protein
MVDTGSESNGPRHWTLRGNSAIIFNDGLLSIWSSSTVLFLPPPFPELWLLPNRL